MPYSNLLKPRTEIVPGKFRCYGDTGVQVQVIKKSFHQVEIKIGNDDAPSLFVDQHSAEVLRDFFAELVRAF